MEDLLEASETIRRQAREGLIAYGINLRYVFQSTNKQKTLDLAIGVPASTSVAQQSDIKQVDTLQELFLACEAKSVMTEHGKSQPRVYDELSSSHEIVHQGQPDAIATGITVVNIASSFVSPLRQRAGSPVHVTAHRQPYAAERMVKHLRGLPVRESTAEVGFDAYTTVVLECDNQTSCKLWEDAPAPQPGDRDHYEMFIQRIIRFYEERFGDLN
jgi:hypothetical protein